jgi:uncharacterized protein (TIGR01777 family)
MNILITGGTGLIGKALADRLIEDGNTVLVISRTPTKFQQLDDRLTYLDWEHQGLVKAIESTDAVINLAGASIAGSFPFQVRWTKKRKKEIISSRNQAGKQLTDAILQAQSKPEILIQASAIGFYGNTGEKMVDEKEPSGSDFLAEICQEWEHSTKSVEELGVRRVIARIGLVFSRKAELLKLLVLPYLFFLGGRIGTGRQYFSWIHIDDLIDSLLFMLRNPKTQGIYNLTAPNPVQNADFSRSLSRTINKPAWLPFPGIILRLLLGEAATLALDGRAVFPRRLLDAGYIFHFDQLDQALKDLFQKL